MVAHAVEFDDEPVVPVQAVDASGDGADLAFGDRQSVRQQDLGVETPFQRALDPVVRVLTERSQRRRMPAPGPFRKGGDDPFGCRPSAGQGPRRRSHRLVLGTVACEVQQRLLEPGPRRRADAAAEASSVDDLPVAHPEAVATLPGPDRQHPWGVADRAVQMGCGMLAEHRRRPTPQQPGIRSRSPRGGPQQVQALGRALPLAAQTRKDFRGDAGPEQLPGGEDAVLPRGQREDRLGKGLSWNHAASLVSRGSRCAIREGTDNTSAPPVGALPSSETAKLPLERTGATRWRRPTRATRVPRRSQNGPPTMVRSSPSSRPGVRWPSPVRPRRKPPCSPSISGGVLASDQRGGDVGEHVDGC